jgi:hypothetical protein
MKVKTHHIYAGLAFVGTSLLIQMALGGKLGQFQALAYNLVTAPSATSPI